ncbi:MAG TPA: SurA N-terminal domain-containing protein [Burkholderiaceae bacterium]|jgi:peptidyl-prolyl cis-trans isomerase D
MLEFIRTHQRLMQFLLLLIIFPSFAFVGIQSYSRFGDADNVVAKVGNQPITQQELEIAQREQIERIKKMFGGQVDPKLFDTPEAKKNALDGLIAQKAISIEATHKRLMPSESQIQSVVLASFPSLADPSLSKEDRIKFYNEIAQEQGMSVAGLQSRIAQGMMRQTINVSVQGTAFVPKTVAAHLADINNQEREVQQLFFKSADYLSQVKITDDMLKDYYNKNDAAFSIPEQAKAEYVVLNNDAVASQVTVNDDEIKAYYEQNKKRYSIEEQRRASHILIAVNKSASDKDKAAAKAKAEGLLAQVRKDPSKFGKLAKEFSQDPGSAEHDGDLGFFEKGAMVKPFEDAVYKLKQGEISDLVQSDFGYHIIQLTGIKPGKVKSLEEVQGDIAAEIKKQKAAKKFAELAEIFTNTVYEQADSLKPAAEKLKLMISTADNLTRQPNPAVAPTAPFNNAKFLNALFSDDAIKNKRNTDAVEVAPNTLIAGRIIEYKPATKRPFNEVQQIVRERVTQLEAAKLAEKAGQAKLAALKAKDDAAGFADTKMVSRAKEGEIDHAAFTDVMKADVTQLPAFVGVEMPGKGYDIYRINKVGQAATPDKAKVAADQQQFETGLAQQEMVAYIDALKQKSKVKILKPIVIDTASTDSK